jgi:hypothetical protein
VREEEGRQAREDDEQNTSVRMEKLGKVVTEVHPEAVHSAQLLGWVLLCDVLRCLCYAWQLQLIDIYVVEQCPHLCVFAQCA